ncbi:MAG: HYR domain-containing protein [Lewinellaceae bacterium]|nr:HYR domain-containing protein [Lewinellaceae bacterium]
MTVDQNPAPGTPVAPGTTIVTLTATDGNSNSMSCDFNLVVSELIPPVAACKPATVQLDANGTGSIAPADVFDATNSSDNCGTATPQSVSPASFSCGDIGPNTVTLTVNDGNGNTATCTATVTVEDNRAPNPACRYRLPCSSMQTAQEASP